MSVQDEVVSNYNYLMGFAIKNFKLSQFDAEDLASTTVLKALENEHQFIPGNLRAWLFTILRNLHYANVRNIRWRRTDATDPRDPAFASAYIVEPVGTSHLELCDVVRVLQLATKEAQEIIVIIAYAGYSYKAASLILKVAMGTIKSRYCRGMRWLKQTLEEDTIRLAPPVYDPVAWFESETARLTAKHANLLQPKHDDRRKLRRAVVTASSESSHCMI